MKENFNKKMHIITILLILTVFFLAFVCYRQNKTIKNYQNALQNPLFKILGNFNSAISSPSTTEILKNAIDNKYISRADASTLDNMFYQTCFNAQDLVGMAGSVTGFYYKLKLNNFTAAVANEFSVYISDYILKLPIGVYDFNDKNTIIKLTDNEITRFKRMKEISDNWIKIINKNIHKNSIIQVKDRAWINLAKDLSNYSNTLKWYSGKFSNQ